MLPFINVFGLTIPMYGLLITLGLCLGILIAIYFPVHRDIPKQDIFFAACFAGIGLYIGAKLLYIIISLPILIRIIGQPEWSLEGMVNLISYGFVFYGGLIGLLAGIFIYGKMFRLPVWPLIDSMVPSIPLIHAIGRIGCYCAGCCYGRPTDSFWGVHFHNDSVAPTNVALFPVQLLESALNLLLFLFLFAFSRKKREDRQITGYYLACYGIMRFFLEFLRADTARGFLLGISTSQWISLCLIPLGLYWLIKSKKQVR